MEDRPVAVVGYDGAELLDIACFSTTLRMANGLSNGQVPYRVTIVSPGQRPVACAPGVVLQSEQALEQVTGPLDTLIVLVVRRQASLA